AWCERCRCQSRCRVYYERRRHEAAERGEPLPSVDEGEEATVLASSPAWEAFLEEANREPTQAEVDEATRADALIEDRLAHAPLVISANEYTEIVFGLTAGLDPLFERRDDTLAQAAIDTVERLGIAVGVKVSRAARSSLQMDGGEDCGLEDANGTAKL